jgi:hypothetical protein
MTTTRLYAALACAMLGGLAHAETKLFPTDLLAPRQADATLSLDGSGASGDVAAQGSGVRGSIQQYGTNLSAQARYGITHALALGAGLQLGSSNGYYKLDNGQRSDAHADGLTATSLFARYALVPTTRDGPYTVTTDFTLTHRHNPGGSTSYNVYGVSGTLSARTTDLVRTYATAGFSVPGKGYASRELFAAGGGWMQLDPGTTATLELGVRRRVANSVQSSDNSAHATVSGIWDVAPRTSARASLTFSRTTASTLKSGGISVRPSNGQQLGLVLYHLY